MEIYSWILKGLDWNVKPSNVKPFLKAKTKAKSLEAQICIFNATTKD